MQYDTSAAPEDDYEGFELDRYKRMWHEAVDLYAEPRKQHYRDEEYYDGDVKGTGWGHWTETELAELFGRKQPPTTRNHVERKVNAVAGVEQRSRSEPRALPRTPKDQKAAEIATDCLRFIKEKTRWEFVKAETFLNALKVGFGGVIINGAQDHVPVSKIRWKEFFFDPRSQEADFSDARYLGVAKWVDRDVALSTYVPPEPQRPEPLPQPMLPPQPEGDPAAFEIWANQAREIIERYKEAQIEHEAPYRKALDERKRIIDTIEATAGGEGSGEQYSDDFEDRPKDTFCDGKRQRIFVIDMWHRDPAKGWFRCVFTGAGKLFTEEATLIETDDWGRKTKTHPIQAFSLFVSRDLWRYGIVRGMRSPQDEVNFRLSKMLHWLMTNQLFYEGGAGIADVEQARREIARPDGALKVNDISKIRVERGLDVARALSAAGEEARQFLEMAGPNPQLQGEQGRATSGRAVLALQQAGLGQLGPIFDRLYEWELRCYRAMWSRVQQFWTAPMYVRVTDDKNAAKFAAVNGAQVVQDGNGAGPEQSPMLGHNGGPPIGREEFGPMLAELDMDIIIDRAPEAATLQAEQFDVMAQLAGTGLFNSMPPMDMARMMITASSLPNKTELLDMIDQMKAKPQEPNPAQMAELKKLLAQVEEIIAKTQKTKAETAQIGVAEIPKAQAETARIGAQARAENVNATMNEISAGDALDMRALMQTGGSPVIDPLAAAALPGEIGLPPIQG